MYVNITKVNATPLNLSPSFSLARRPDYSYQYRL